MSKPLSQQVFELQQEVAKLRERLETIELRAAFVVPAQMRADLDAIMRELHVCGVYP